MSHSTGQIQHYDALLLPGGVADQLRTIDKAVQFVTSFFDAGSLLPFVMVLGP